MLGSLPSVFLSAVALPMAAAVDDLLADIPAPPNGKTLGTESISSGGQKANYATSPSVVWPENPADDNCG